MWTALTLGPMCSEPLLPKPFTAKPGLLTASAPVHKMASHSHVLAESLGGQAF